MIKTQVRKKDNSIQDWDPSKVLRAINLAARRTTQPLSSDTAEAIITYVAEHIEENPVPVTTVHKLVENALMHFELFDIAREYISYRNTHRPDIFRKRTQYKPFEYPELADFRLAILNNFWLHTHYNYNSDIQDMLVNMPPADALTAKRTILAISQIEVKVKNFWGRIGAYLPKPEIEEVGAVFASNEVVHAMAYSNLLEIMNLNDEFAALLEVPAIRRRVQYLERAIVTPVDNEEYLLNILLFSMFIENVSLFSQFYLLLRYYKNHKWLKGTSNTIRATSTEETIHGKYGFALVNTIKSEHPEWWTPELVSRIYSAADDALQAESEVLSWITEQTPELYDEAYNFILSRMNQSLTEIGLAPTYKVDPAYDFTWFNLMVAANNAVDFFDTKSTAYSKGLQSFSADDLF